MTPNAVADASDEVFRARLRSEALDWLRRLHSGDATAGDAAAMEHWRASSPAHAREFAEASLLWTVLGDAAAQAERNRAASAASSMVRVDPFLPARRGFLFGGAALAASAAGFLVLRPPLDLWPSATELLADYRTATGERRHVDLPSEVAVELNTRTSLDVRPPGGGVGFELLTGEAAISHRNSKDGPLVVLAGDGRIVSRHASFNVRKDNLRVRVDCITGGVEVICRDRSFALVAGKGVSYDAQGNGEVATIDTEMVTAWRRGLLMFRRVPLSEMITEVNRYRPGHIVLVDSALGRRQVIANFRLDRIEEVIDFLSAAMNVRVRTLPGGVVLVG